MDRFGQHLDNSNIVNRPRTRLPTPPQRRAVAAGRGPRDPTKHRSGALGTRLPAYALYGEAAALGDVLHVESIAERSRLHDWEIGPHRHESLFQFLIIRSGELRVWLDGADAPLTGPCVITVPALTAHAFRFSPAVDGHVFTLVDRHLRDLIGADAAWLAAVARPRAWRLAEPVQTPLLALADLLRADHAGHDRWRAQAVDSALCRLLLELARSAPEPSAAGAAQPPRALLHVQRLRALVDQQFRQQPTLTALARQIGITPTQLNRACQQVLGHAAQGVLHARVLLEAQRDLAYTTMSIKQVALGLGFQDAGYFTRFFQRLAGCTPSAWRQARAVR
jgi:AraC family transcriptional regulator, transcriptional activator of pobA